MTRPVQQPFTWYLPSFYGDIRLEAQGPKQTKVTLHGLSPQEKIAVKALLQRASQESLLRTSWASTATLNAVNLESTLEQQLVLTASITEVQKVLVKPLKPNRKQLSVVKFSGGKIEELTEAAIQLIEATTVAEENAPPAPAASPPSAVPVLAATVAEPQRGCPAPDFEAAELRASRVLEAFLTPEQSNDFRRDQCFLSTGVDTGHRYLITSRYARSRLAIVNRSLFDIDEGRAYCVHDWEVPAAEEMLALHLHLQCPTREMFLRGVREDHIEGGA